MSDIECKILTYNLFHDLPRHRHLDRRLALIAQAIAELRPDVVGLQEVPRARSCGDIGERLCAMVNRRAGGAFYRLFYAAADGAGEDDWAFEEGVALMGRLEPLLEQPAILKYREQVRLTTKVSDHEYRLTDDRVALGMSYRTAEGAALDVCVTHLTDVSEAAGGPRVRIEQARELVAWVDSWNRGRNPALIAGDFNDLPESETIGALLRAGFVDAHAAAGCGAGYTNDRNDLDLESESAALNQRIDYVFFRPGAGGGRVAEARLFMERPAHLPEGGWLWGSDHLGVLARIRL